MRQFFSVLLIGFTALLFTACSEPSAPAVESPADTQQNTPSDPIAASPLFNEQEAAAAAVITGENLRAVVAEIADDRYQGRGPGSEGDEMTRQFLIQQMTALGLQPGGDNGSWEQEFALIGINSAMPDSWTFSTAAGELNLARSEDFVAASGVQQATAQINEAEVVFVGYGIQAPEFQWDDFKDIDLTGKVLLMLNNDPDWDPDLFAGDTRLYYGRWIYKFESAARQGAAGAIILHTTPSAAYPWQVVQTSFTGEQFELPAVGEPRTQVNAWLTEEATREMLALTGIELDDLLEQARHRDFQPVPLGITTSLTLNNTISQKTSANVIGLLPGNDPLLSSEAVIYSAHHDHLGMAEPTGEEGEDLIYNGALDNASGVAQVLEIARAFSALEQPPRRSVVFNFVGAEEQGLLGSEYYARNPGFPAGKIAANLNIDGGSIWGRTRDISYIGYGKSSLDTVVEAVADIFGRTVSADQFPDRGSFYRSDQFNFARIGVPAIYLKAGTDVIGKPPGWGVEQINQFNEVDYHQPDDHLARCVVAEE
jgi:Zn-dependent M28 family amino/carboxypeptidase